MKKIHIGIVCDQFGNFDRGGAEVQIENTVAALNKIEGISTEIISSQTRDLSRFDLFHFFKSSISYYYFAETLKRQNIPYVISTIIYPEKKTDTFRFKFLHYTPFLNKISWVKMLYNLWNNAAMLFPNTDKELSFLRSIGVGTDARIIPNGLNLDEMEIGDEEAFYTEYPFLRAEKFVLNVARIDRRKNQKNLVKACMELDIPVVLIGNKLDQQSFSDVEQIGYSKLYYLGPIYDKKILFGAYKACSVFCLPSTMETPGISAMEAAYFNKPLVITKYGGTEYYFKNNAFYVEWRSVDEIKNGIETMMSKEIETRSLIEQYSWNKIAEMYVKEYQRILK